MNIGNGGLGFTQTLDNEDFKRKLRESMKEVNGFSAKSVTSMDSIQVKASDLAKGIGAVFTVGAATNFIQEMVKVRGEFEQLEIAFTTMLGSKERADNLMMEIVDFAAKTPFGLQSTSEATKMLLAYGESAETALDTMRKLGDIASGVGIPLKDIAYLYGTTMTQGRLYTQDLNQFLGRGIPMMDELAKIFNVNKNEVKALVEEGKVGFPEVQKVIENLTASGSMFGGLMEAQSNSIAGQIEQLKDAFDVMLNDIGKGAQPIVAGLINSSATLVENYDKVGKVLGVLITTYGAYKAALITLDVVEKMRYTTTLAIGAAEGRVTAMQALRFIATTKLTAAQAALNAVMLANPIVLVVTAVAGLTAAYFLLRDTTTEAEKAQERFNKTQDKVKSAVENTKKKAEEYISVLKDETATVYQQIKAYEALQALRLKGLRDLSQEQIQKMDLTEINKLLNQSMDSTGLQAQRNELNKFSQQIEKIKKQIQDLANAGRGGDINTGVLKQQLKEVTAQYEKQYDLVTKMESEQKMANMTLDQKRAYWENIISATEKQINTINQANNKQAEGKTILGVNLDLVNQTGTAFQMWNVNPLISQLEQAKTELLKINTVVGSEVKVSKNKSFWEQQKKEASDARDALVYTEKGSKQWNELTKKINEANTALQTYNDSYQKPKTTNVAKPKATKKSDDPLEVFKKEVSTYKEQYERLTNYLNTKDKELNIAGEALKVTLSSKGQTYLDFLQKQAEQLRKSASISELARKQLIVINDEIYSLLNQSQTEDFKKQIEKDLQSAQSLIERINLIKKAKEELTGKTDQISIDKLKFIDEKDLQNQFDVETYLKDETKKFEEQYQYLEVKRKEYDAEMLLLQEQYNKASNDSEKRRIQDLINIRSAQYFEDTNSKTNNIEVNRIIEESKSLAQKRLDIEREYAGKISLIQAQINSETSVIQLKLFTDVITEIERKQKEALQQVDGEIIRKSKSWVGIFSDYSRKSSLEIAKMITQIQQQLSNTSLTSTLSVEDIKALQDRLRELKDYLSKNDPFVSLGTSIQNMITKAKETGKVDFSDIRSAVGDLKNVVGEVTSMAEGLGIEISDSTASAIQLGSELLDAGMNIAEGIASKNPMQVVKGIVAGITSIINAGDRKKERQIQKYKQAVNELTKAFNQLQIAADKALGGDSYKNQQSMIENLRKQQEEYRKMIEAEKGKKKTNNGKIEEYEQAIIDAGNKINEIMDNITQDILQTTAKDLADTLGDALVDAFSKGEDAAKSFEKVANDVLKNAVLNQLKKNFLEKQLQSALDGLQEQMGVTGLGWNGLTPEQQQQFRDKIADISAGFTGALDAYADLFKDLEDADANSLSGAIKGVSEETASLIAGQMNAIRIMQAEGLEIHRNSNNVLIQQLDQLFRIEFNTRSITPMLERIHDVLNTESSRGWGH